ncbi:MAG: hypothetical protein M1816_001058 [Peltula sp. TS41687]|nr:MAG: hypothetical protein M1816_001058 [Peltula sp. TS41687]
MERHHDRRYDDRGRVPERESYHSSHRQGRSPPPRVENFRSNRPAPYPRGRTPPPADTYFPTGGRPPRPRSRSPSYARRRSRSPQFHQRRASPPPNNGWKTGERPPPRRGYSPRRDHVRREDRPRSPPAPPARRARSRSPPVVESRRISPRDIRERSPVGVKRQRDFSPGPNRGLRSPPPAKRERMISPPRGRYEQRAPSASRGRRHSPGGYPRNNNWQQPSRSPPRREDTYHHPSQVRSQYKVRSPSPVHRRSRHEHRPEETSGRQSRNSSRPVSPHMHPNRLAVQHPTGSGDRSRSSVDWGAEDMHAPSPGHGGHQSAPRSPPRSPPYQDQPMVDVERSGHWGGDRERSPPPRAYSPPPRSPRGNTEYHSSATTRKRDYSPPREEMEPEYYDSRPPGRYSQSSGLPYRNGHAAGYGGRGPHPGGSSRRMSSSTANMAPPSGPSSAPISMSAHNRPGNVSVLAAPTHPRAGGAGPPPPPPPPPHPRDGAPYPGPSRGRGLPHHYGPPRGYHRGGHYGPPPPHMSGGHRDRSPVSSGGGGSGGAGVPTGPRSGGHAGHPPPYRPPPHSHNSTSRTYPLTQRFSRHISDLPAAVPGGKLLPSNVEKSVSERLAKLTQEQSRLEQELAEKLEKKRNGLRNWDRLERESARDGLKSELAEQQVRVMSGESGMGGAAF